MNSKLSVGGKELSCAIYSLHDLSERENSVNTKLSVKVASHQQFSARKRGLDSSSRCKSSLLHQNSHATQQENNENFVNESNNSSIPLDKSKETSTSSVSSLHHKNFLLDLPFSPSKTPFSHVEKDTEGNVPYFQRILDADYIQEAFCFMLSRQQYFQPDSNFLHLVQKEITEVMRKTLIDWMAEVIYEYKKGLPTLFLSINYLDRYLSKVCVSKKQLQLLGTACLLLAAKMEEIKPFQLSELVIASDNYFSESQLIEMELKILQALNFELSIPTLYEFVSYLGRAIPNFSRVTKQAVHLAHSLLYDTSILHTNLPHDLALRLYKIASLGSNIGGISSACIERDLLEFEIERVSFQNINNDELIGLKRCHET